MKQKEFDAVAAKQSVEEGLGFIIGKGILITHEIKGGDLEDSCEDAGHSFRKTLEIIVHSKKFKEAVATQVGNSFNEELFFDGLDAASVIQSQSQKSIRGMPRPCFDDKENN